MSSALIIVGETDAECAYQHLRFEMLCMAYGVYPVRIENSDLPGEIRRPQLAAVGYDLASLSMPDEAISTWASCYGVDMRLWARNSRWFISVHSTADIHRFHRLVRDEVGS